MMNKIFNLIWRLPLFLLHIFSGLMQELGYFLVYGKNWHEKPVGQNATQRWMKRLSSILGLKISVSGTASSYYSTLLVANHISWLDIIALSSLRNIVFMAKSDVKHWPVFGLLVKASGTLFIDRGSKSALKKAIKDLTIPLRQGRTVAIFPEGTTTNGSTVESFYSGLFSAAITTESYIQPVAITYRRNDQRDTIAPYTLEDTFFSHILKILQQNSTHIYLNFLPKIRTQTYTRAELADLSRDKIKLALQDTPSADLNYTLPFAKSI